MAAPNLTLEPKQIDFLYWYAVSKMRMADFEGASTLFRLLHAASPERTDTALGRVYCLLRLGEMEAASGLVTALRRHPLRPDEMALLGRLQRRCEFERTGTATRRRAGAAGPGPGSVHVRDPVTMPHTLGDDDMARRAAERG